MTANFDRIARPYRWLEYLSLGPLLERTRNAHLPALAAARQALILGDGDGRFTARLLATCPDLRAEAVDSSAVMLHLLQNRARTNANRLKVSQADARKYIPGTASGPPPDLIVTHFFLDCLTQAEVDTLIARLAAPLAPGALWLVSDFRIPPTGPMHWPARVYIRLLYLAFRVVTGLRTDALPDYATPFSRAGLRRIATFRTLAGLLTSELWQRPPTNC